MRRTAPAIRTLSLVVLVACAIAPSAARAEWNPDGEPVTGADCSSPLVACDDHAGGLYTFWQHVTGTEPPVVQVFAQHRTPDGSPAPGWPAAGRLVVGVESDAMTPGNLAVLPDGAGGAYLWLRENRFVGNPVPLQHRLFRMRSDGTLHPAWPDSGLLLGREPYTGPGVLAPDGAGGVYVGLVDDVRLKLILGVGGIRLARLSELRLARVGGEGTLAPGWSAEGALVRSVAPESLEFEPHPSLTLVADGQGGALLAWADSSDGLGLTRLWRYGAAGAPAGGWPAAGVSFMPGPSDLAPGLVADGAGGAYLAWTDSLPPEGQGAARLLRLDGSGLVAPGWPAGGTLAGIRDLDWQLMRGIAPDGAGGVYAQVEEFSSTGGLLRLMHVGADAGAVPGWPAQGMLLPNANQGYGGLNTPVPDAGGGVHAVWATSNALAIAHLRVAFDGTVLAGWSAAAPRIETLPASQQEESVVGDGFGAVYLTWKSLDTENCEAFAWQLGQREPAVAAVAPPGARALALAAQPNPSPGAVDLAFTLPHAGDASVEVYEIGGRRVRAWRSAMSAGPHRLVWDGRTDAGEAVAPGLYFVLVGMGEATVSRRVAIVR